MSVTKKDVEHIAKLARLKVTEEEVDHYTGQLNQILTYVEKLNELKPSIKTEEALKNAPDKDDEHFKVPKVINQD